MEKALEAFRREISHLRTGRASVAILDDIRVDYYGAKTPLAQVATLGSPEPRLITVAPWQPDLIPVIEKAILNSNLGLNPVNDGKLIRLPIPALTEERRKDLVKIVKNYAEEARIQTRHARRDAMDEIKKGEKDSQISEDDAKKAGVVIQKMTDDAIVRIDESAQKKEKEILTV